MELVVRTPDGNCVVCLLGSSELLEGGPRRIHVRRLDVQHSAAGEVRLDQSSAEVHTPQVSELDAPHADAAMRGPCNDAFRFELHQRLTYRGQADLQPSCEVGLTKPLP